MPVNPCDLGFSVVVFLVVAVACLALLTARRRLFGYELGGKGKYASGSVLVVLWLLYILLASLQSAGFIKVALVSDSSLCPM